MSGYPAPPGTEKTPWFPLWAHFRRRLGGPARKVPLDAGFSCPNRDGTLSRSGCLFCNPLGSGTGLAAQGLSLAGQWGLISPRVRAKYPNARLVAYLQAYTNTHASPQGLRALLAEIAALPGVAGLCLGTRPDCLDVDADQARLDVLGGFVSQGPGGGQGRGFGFLQLDLGLQSADPEVLRRIGRGHGPEVFARAVRAAQARGLEVCAHLMHGLPGAGPEDLTRSVDFLNGLPISGIKFHNTLVCRGTGLERLWRAGEYVPATLAEYVEAVALALARLRPDVCVQRLTADPAPGELLAPDWAADKSGVLALLRRVMDESSLWQGRDGHCPDARPEWWA